MILGGLLFYAAALLVSAVTPLDLGNPATGEVTFMLSAYGAVAAWIVWACRRFGISLRRLMRALPEGYSWLATLGLLAVTIVFSAGSWMVLAYGLVLVAPGVLEFVLGAVHRMPDPPLAYRVAIAVVAVVLAPVIEEVLFRGILLNRWAVKWSVGGAVVATSIAFGLLHANPVGITVVGLVAAILYLRTRTLLVPIAFHAANNLVATILDFMMGPVVPLDLETEFQEIRDTGLWGVAIVAVTLPVLVWYLRRHWPAREEGIPYSVPADIAENT